MALMTQADCIARWGGRSIQAAQFSTDDITVAEYRYIQSMLGADLYAAVVAGSGSGGAYVTFVTDYIKPALAWFTLYTAADRLMVEMGDRGFMRLSADNAQPMSEAQRDSFKAGLLDNANTFLEVARQYVIARVEADDVLYKGLYTIDTDEIAKNNAFMWTSNPRRVNHF